MKSNVALGVGLLMALLGLFVAGPAWAAETNATGNATTGNNTAIPPATEPGTEGEWVTFAPFSPITPFSLGAQAAIVVASLLILVIVGWWSKRDRVEFDPAKFQKTLLFSVIASVLSWGIGIPYAQVIGGLQFTLVLFVNLGLTHVVENVVKIFRRRLGWGEPPTPPQPAPAPTPPTPPVSEPIPVGGTPPAPGEKD